MGDSLFAEKSPGIAAFGPVLSVLIIRRIQGGLEQTSVDTVGLMKKDDSKLLKLVGRLLALLATDAYASGEGFEFMIVEQDIGDCLDRLPLPQNLKQVRGTVYQTKGKGDAKERALWLVTNRASLSPKLSDDVALYILNCSDDRRIGDNLLQRTELSELVRAEAAKLAQSEERNQADRE